MPDVTVRGHLQRSGFVEVEGRWALKASGSRPSLDCEWRSMFDFNLVKIAGAQVKSGSTLSEALDQAEAQRIYLSEDMDPSILPTITFAKAL